MLIQIFRLKPEAHNHKSSPLIVPEEDQKYSKVAHYDPAHITTYELNIWK